ncbi:N-acetylglucosamine kinase [Granulicella sibirica]|uniref:N-acetylglucosamine kinase of eukaryotic type n=1 Tax=Granulicella sibirica TaxID=2479048 RepID=A0A4Q0SZI0_9BACT|nr:BadF/BadG/BcrA/BcrD ATPase family protein [Granulicella sibirica]RXH56297.1 N-acetylglucosamine kinase of eukaryotic type [Granulicella sibirica]
MSFYLALDAGGTKTDYVLADETRELVRVRTGTIKRMRTDAETAAANLDSALEQIQQRSGVSMRSITRTCVGTAGETVPLVADWLRTSITARVGGELLLLGDVEIALDAAFPNETGVLVMGGTGSNVAGRGADGRLTTAGGYGPALADQGSGHRIGYQALRAMFLARDEGRPTRLMDEVLEFWNVSSIGRLIEFANSVPPPDFTKLTELVVRLALDGDEVALAVVENEGRELGHLVNLVLRRLERVDAAAHVGWVPKVAFTGSIMEKVPLVRRALVAEVTRVFPSVQARDGVVDPLEGAVWRARRNGNG